MFFLRTKNCVQCSKFLEQFDFQKVPILYFFLNPEFTNPTNINFFPSLSSIVILNRYALCFMLDVYTNKVHTLIQGTFSFDVHRL